MNKMELVKSILSDMTYDESIRSGIWKHKSDTYQEFFHHAHGDFMPDDFRYKMIHSLLCSLSEYENLDDIDTFEICDNNVPIYNNELLQWVASHLSRFGYVEESISEYGYPSEEGFFKTLQYGYFRELEEVLSLILEWLDENIDEGND